MEGPSGLSLRDSQIMSHKEKKVIYYTDELSDDFAGTNIHAKPVDDSFKFLHTSLLWRVCSNLLYYGVAVPAVWLFMRVVLGVRFVNRSAVKACKTPCFLYGNHTDFIDAFIPNLLSLPHRNHILVGADTVSIPGLRTVVQMFGALPLPTGSKGWRKFLTALDVYRKRANVTVYPEAHIWRFYTGVRNFPDTSFAYPIRFGMPTVAFFTAYSKPKKSLAFWRKATITVYVSDPMYPLEGVSEPEARRDLRDRVYAFMKEKSALSDYEIIHYERREPS